MSIKSLGKIAAVAAAAGLTLTACADDSVSQSRDQEETCGFIMGAETKANEGIQSGMMSVQQGQGADSDASQASQALESAALDIRNYSYNVSDSQQNPDTGEEIPLRTALQVHAAYFDEMASLMDGGMEAMQGFDPSSFEAEGTTLTSALETINGYCASYAQQQMQGQMPQQQMPQQQMPQQQMPQQQMPQQGMPQEQAPAPEEEAPEEEGAE
ncbi:MAG: hypothetical protein HLX51_14780 [Micrococcaceae bacterium]|nr:hypothetical protein [Micrococcaceae bacterium]